jgi:hypothetical protein
VSDKDAMIGTAALVIRHRLLSPRRSSFRGPAMLKSGILGYRIQVALNDRKAQTLPGISKLVKASI